MMTHPMIWILSDVVSPALGRVVPNDAIERLQLAMMQNPYNTSHANDAIGLEVQISDEVFRRDVYAPEVFISVERSRDQLVSDLADWVAESSFGWGQKRD
jgi:hypothetical protein